MSRNIQMIRAQFVPSTMDAEQRTVDVVFATPTPVLRYSWSRDEMYNEVLDMNGANLERASKGLPVLDNHGRWGSVGQILGRAEKIRRNGEQWEATVRFSKREEIQTMVSDIQDGIITDISFGYSVDKVERMEKKDQENYRTYMVRTWTPTEISFVTIPADPRAGVRSEDGKQLGFDLPEVFDRQNPEPPQNQQNLNQGVIMKREQIIAALAKRGITVDANISDEALNAELERALTTQGEDPEAVRKAATEAERKRVADITSAVRSAKLPNDFAEKLISEGKSIDESRAAIIEEFAKEDPNKGRSAQRVEGGNDRSAELRAQAVTAGIILRGKPELLRGERKLFSDEVIAEAQREYRGMRLLDLAKDALTRGGIDFKGLNDVEIVGRAFTSSSSDFGVLLEGANRTVLLANYQAASDTWRRFCTTGSVSDFREHKRLRMGTFSDLQALEENGEYKNKKITDADFEKVSVDTKGNIINVTRKMIINDDLSAFLRLPEMLGRAAARSIENDVYALLKEGSGLGPVMADGNRLFHASHKNIATPGAPVVAVLDAMRQQMAIQTDKDGNDFLDIRPHLALSPLSLGSTLRELNAMEYNSTAQKEEKRPNVVRGIFNDIIDTPRLTGTAYYMFADPSIEPVLEVNFLNGEQNPYMESEQGFTTDGVRWKIRLDYGVDAIGWRGVIRNAGA
jgi:hypothetical protein